MFKFFKHENVTKKEEEIVTVNTTEQVADSTIETGGVTNAELFYKSPEYKETTEVYELVGSEGFFTELQQELTADTADFYEDDWEAVVDEVDQSELITEVQPEPTVVNEGIVQEEKNPESPSQNFVNIRNRILSASAALSVGLLAACDKTTKNEFGISPSFQWGPNGEKKVVEFGVGFRTKNEQIDLDGNTIKPISESTQAPAQPEKVSPVTPVAEGAIGKNIESTTPTKVGVAEVFEQYSKEIIPSGDPRYGYLTLNEATAIAAARGGLKPFPRFNVYALEVSEDPAKQGIPYKSIWILKLSENKIPRPLIKGDSTFNKYISRTKGGVWHVTPEKLNLYKKDLANSVPDSKNAKGVIDHAKHERLSREIENYGILELNTILEWKNTNPAGQTAMLDKWVKPYQNRKGTIKDNK